MAAGAEQLKRAKGNIPPEDNFQNPTGGYLETKKPISKCMV